jgi:DNA polymerase III alpha subunit
MVKNFISPISHPASYLSGSTLGTMVEKVKNTCQTGYFVSTDTGLITDTYKAYLHAKKEGLKPILGCEIFFVDSNCPIISSSNLSKAKYFTLALHAIDQEAYQFFVKKISETNRNTIEVLEIRYPTFNWQDLEEFSKYNFTVVVGGLNGFVSKAIALKETKSVITIVEKLKQMFDTRLYLSVTPIAFDQIPVTMSNITFTNGQTVSIESNILANSRYAKRFKVTVGEICDNIAKHVGISSIYINDIHYKVEKDIASALNTKTQKKQEDLFALSNTYARWLGKKFNIKTLLTDHAFYAEPEDKLAQDLKLENSERIPIVYNVKTSQDAIEILSKQIPKEEIEEMIKNSYQWASIFDNFNLNYGYRLVKDETDHLSALMEIIKKVGRFDHTDPVRLERFKMELNTLSKNGKVDLLPYFFPIYKAINFYKEKGRVVGVARGSAGGSYIAYLMGITQIDPIKYDLSFSRFLTKGRVLSGLIPDVDVDICDRELLVGENGFLETYYKGRWAQVSTRSLTRLKSAIKDVNRYLKGKVEPEIEKFSKNLEPAPQGVDDQDFVFGYEDQDGNHIPGLIEKDPKLLQYTLDRPDEWEIVKKTLGVTRQHGRHASAFVISDSLITETVPLMEVAGFKNVTQYEAKEVEAAGLIKYDFLIIKCLNDIEMCIRYINKTWNKTAPSGEHFYDIKTNSFQYIWDLPETAEVFKDLHEGKTETVFQLNTESVTPFVKKMKPQSVSDIAVVTSLVRPGPLDFIDENTGRNMAEEYVERINGKGSGRIPLLDKLLPETQGVFVFQEQLTKVVKEMTGWDDEKAEDVRIAVGKKKIKLIMELAPQFIRDSIEKGYEESLAKQIWSMIETFGRYGFNKCVSGDTVLLKNRNGYKKVTVSEMYKTKNDKQWAKENGKESLHKKYNLQGYGKSFSKKDNRIYPNEIVDIRYEGKKEVYKIVTETGRFIKTTDNHKFPTPNGTVMLKDLKVGEELFVNGGWEKSDNTYRFGENNLPQKGQMGFQKKPDSSFSLYKKRREHIKKTQNNCSFCFCDLTDKRKEIHHKNGDHGDQNWDNLALTCASCHKKEHYKMGRTKQGEKGLVCKTEKITSIEFAGIEDVYDIEMAAPYHNFVTDTGIVTCNSHAVAYSKIAYACAYLKHNYKLEWWAAVISNADEKEITEVFWPYIKDILTPPDINLSDEVIQIDYKEQKIRNKLSSLKGLGPSVAEKIMSNRPYKNLFDYVSKQPAGDGLNKKLIHVGVLDSFFSNTDTLVDKIRKYDQAKNEWDYRKKINEKTKGEIALDLPLDEFIEKAKQHPASKRMKHEIKQAESDVTYALMTPIEDFLAKKAIAPTYSVTLSDIVKKYCKKTKIINTPKGAFVSVKHREIPLVNGKTYEKIKNLPCQPDNGQFVNFCIVAYVIKTKEFTYSEGTKKALKMIVEIDNVQEELVLWPNYDTGELNYPENLKTGSVVFFSMSRKMSKEKYHTNIMDIVVEC